MYDLFSDFIKDKRRICVIQAENPDGDSLGSALALDYLLPDKQISLYCPVEMPDYLHYYEDWSRVSLDFDYQADAYILVDTAAQTLITKIYEDPAAQEALASKPVLVLDHHQTPDDLEFDHQAIVELLPACCELIYRIAKDQQLEPNPTAAKYLYLGIASDTLGLTASGVTATLFREVAELVDLGVDIPALEELRREYNRKSQRILEYKADLIKRVEYHLDGRLATVHIPWEDIESYSQEYNPGVLILDELRQVVGVEIAVAVKTYPDGKVTGKIRTSLPIADQVAGYFGGGGHSYAAGFRTYDTDYTEVRRELVQCSYKLLQEAHPDETL